MKPWLTKGTLVPEVFLAMELNSFMFRVFILSGSFVYVEMKNRLKHKDCGQSFLIYFV